MVLGLGCSINQLWSTANHEVIFYQTYNKNQNNYKRDLCTTWSGLAVFPGTMEHARPIVKRCCNKSMKRRISHESCIGHMKYSMHVQTYFLHTCIYIFSFEKNNNMFYASQFWITSLYFLLLQLSSDFFLIN